MINWDEGEIVLIDKPLNWTSFDVVNKIRHALKHKFQIKKIKVGHAGTLDPLATGLLIIAIGRKTKSIQDLQGLDKTYTGSMRIGAITASYDAETAEENVQIVEDLELPELKKVASLMEGSQEQLPPIYSAKNIDGKRAYQLAREGKKPEMRTKLIQLHHFEILNLDQNILEFEINCSTGTYIRSVAHDFGQEIKLGAYLKSLKRTSVGPYKLESAHQLNDWISKIENWSEENAL